MPTAAPGKNPVKYTYTHKSIAVGFCNVTCDWLVLLPLCSIFLADDDCSLSHIYTAIKSLFLLPPFDRFLGPPLQYPPPPLIPNPPTKVITYSIMLYNMKRWILPPLRAISLFKQTPLSAKRDRKYFTLRPSHAVWTYPIPLSWVRPIRLLFFQSSGFHLLFCVDDTAELVPPLRCPAED